MNQSFFTMGGKYTVFGRNKEGRGEISFCQQSVKGDKCND